MPTEPATQSCSNKSPSEGHVLLSAADFQTAWRGTRTARRKRASDVHACSYRLVGHSSSPGATCFLEPLPDLFRLAGSHFPPGAMCFELFWFSLITWQRTPSRQAAYPKPLGATPVASLLLVFGILKQVPKNPKHYTYNP